MTAPTSTPNPTFETLLYEIEDNILTITLNRPEKLNAFNNVMRDEIIDALDHAAPTTTCEPSSLLGPGAPIARVQT